MARQDVEAVYRRTYEHLTRTASVLLGDSELAHDIVHDIVLSVLNAERRGHEPVTAAYLQLSVRRACVRAARRRARIVPLHDHATRSELAAAEADPAAVVLAEQLLSKLPPRSREVAELYAAGFHYQEIAHMLGISRNTVNAHLQTARRVIRASSRE
jgi:RNA polymerase sigma-70 factor, ECF subfamily